MDDMNTTSDQQGPYGPGPGPTSAASEPSPQPTPPPHQDLDRLRRSVSDRYIAGVAGGLGRHFDVDPTIVRVLLAVLTLFGGAGVLIYGVCWAFVPEDGKERAAINIGSDARKILLLAAAGIAALLAVGDVFSGFNAGWPIAAVAVVIAVIMIARDRRTERRAAGPQYPTTYPDPQQYAREVTDQVTAQVTAQVDEQVARQYGTPPYRTDQYAAAQPPAWYPPVVRPAILPPHPKRTGILWFWPTLAMIAIALGIVGMVDANHDVTVGVYPAVALAITGVMLLIGSFVGRPGGLILVGVVSTIALSAATVLGTFDVDGRDQRDRPASAAAVQPAYSGSLGRIELDLSDVVDPQNLAGRTLDLELNAGEILVIVPKELNIRIDAEMGFAGGIKVPGYDGGGVEEKVTKFVSSRPATSTAPLELDLDVRVGQITVEHR